MSPASSRPPQACTAFNGVARVASGTLADVTAAARALAARDPAASILVFDDDTGALVEVDLRPHAATAPARTETDADRGGTGGTGHSATDPGAARGPGRPRLGVIAREVTLLPRHWEWLSSQPGGASVALRRLVEEARKARAGADRRRRAQEAAYRFMSAIAGDLPGYEEALRALFAGAADRFHTHTRPWPASLRTYARHLAAGAFDTEETRP